jgi:hypothetical protein
MKPMLEQFIDDAGGLGFPNAKFRGEPVPWSTQFGIDLSTEIVRNGVKWPLRIHPATDRGRGRKAIVISPFDFTSSDLILNYGSFGTMVILRYHDEFEIRIAHMNPDHMTPGTVELLKNERPIPSGRVIGTPGDLGLSFGAHTHTEIVSIKERSPFLDNIMGRKGFIPGQQMTREEIEAEFIMLKRALGKMDSLQKLHHYFQLELERRKILIFGKKDIQRVDYHTGQIRTFYDSKLLFRI